MSQVFALPALIPSQEILHKKHCFGDCGKVSMAGCIDMGDQIGPCWACPEDSCPYEMKRSEPLGTSEWTGDEICLRSLKEK